MIARCKNQCFARSVSPAGGTQPGFTIIELLVVVAVIALLIALLMPSLKSARDLARRTVCASNTRQLYQCQLSYLSDSQGTMFAYWWHPSAGNRIWIRQLQPYIQQADLLICPSTANPPGTTRIGQARLTWVEARHGEVTPWDRSSYGYNTWLCPDNRYIPDADSYTSLMQIREPSRVPLLGDAVWRDLIAGTLKVFPSDLNDPYSVTTAAMDHAAWWCTDRHDRVTNVSFMDGSSRSIDLPQLWSLQWHKAYDASMPVNGVPADY